jgi:hypothetical protein
MQSHYAEQAGGQDVCICIATAGPECALIGAVSATQSLLEVCAGLDESHVIIERASGSSARTPTSPGTRCGRSCGDVPSGADSPAGTPARSGPDRVPTELSVTPAWAKVQSSIIAELVDGAAYADTTEVNEIARVARVENAVPHIFTAASAPSRSVGKCLLAADLAFGCRVVALPLKGRPELDGGDEEAAGFADARQRYCARSGACGDTRVVGASRERAAFTYRRRPPRERSARREGRSQRNRPPLGR